jgi:hypothetical protein
MICLSERNGTTMSADIRENSLIEYRNGHFDQLFVRRSMELIAANPGIAPDMSGSIDRIRSKLVAEFGEARAGRAPIDALLGSCLHREVSLEDFGEYGDGPVAVWAPGALSGRRSDERLPRARRQ